jgi:hypothetical protein
MTEESSDDQSLVETLQNLVLKLEHDVSQKSNEVILERSKRLAMEKELFRVKNNLSDDSREEFTSGPEVETSANARESKPLLPTPPKDERVKVIDVRRSPAAVKEPIVQESAASSELKKELEHERQVRRAMELRYEERLRIKSEEIGRLQTELLRAKAGPPPPPPPALSSKVPSTAPNRCRGRLSSRAAPRLIWSGFGRRWK